MVAIPFFAGELVPLMGGSVGLDKNDGSYTGGIFGSGSVMLSHYGFLTFRAYLEGGYSTSFDNGFLSAVGGFGIFLLIFELGVIYLPERSERGRVLGVSFDFIKKFHFPRIYAHWIKFEDPGLQNQFRMGFSYYFSLIK